jgi:hypothetical protein
MPSSSITYLHAALSAGSATQLSASTASFRGLSFPLELAVAGKNRSPVLGPPLFAMILGKRQSATRWAVSVRAQHTSR